MTAKQTNTSDQEMQARALAVLAAAGIEADPMRGVLRARGSPAGKLRPQSMAVLIELAARAGQVVPRAHLLAAVWGTRLVTDDSLVQCVLDIRRVLGPDSARLLRTLPRRGYLFDVARGGLGQAPAVHPWATPGDPQLPAHLPAEAFLVHADGDPLAKHALAEALRGLDASSLKVVSITCVAIKQRRLPQGLALTIAAAVRPPGQLHLSRLQTQGGTE